MCQDTALGDAASCPASGSFQHRAGLVTQPSHGPHGSFPPLDLLPLLLAGSKGPFPDWSPPVGSKPRRPSGLRCAQFLDVPLVRHSRAVGQPVPKEGCALATPSPPSFPVPVRDAQIIRRPRTCPGGPGPQGFPDYWAYTGMKTFSKSKKVTPRH